MEIGRGRHRILLENLPVSSIDGELKKLKANRVIERIFEHDHTVWSISDEEISNRLGWLKSEPLTENALQDIDDFVKQARNDGYRQALLLGMGGSSMAPEVFSKVFPVQPGYLELDVLDSTDPDAILGKEQQLNLAQTLFIVSTKSGGTVETVSLMKYFYNRVFESTGDKRAGQQFIAITDPGSSLEKTAHDLNFKKIFLNDPNIGGRYSALSYFGLVPAALMGVNLEKLLLSFGAMLSELNTSVWLGAALGVLGKNGRDKLTFIASPSIQPLGAWLEQLIAESTGKKGTGLLPVDGETVAEPHTYTKDRLFFYFRMGEDQGCDEKAERLKSAGHPVIQLNLQDKYSLGGEFFRWMMAVAVAGSVMGINPFDQPNVESAKVLGRQMVAEYMDKGCLPASEPDLKINGIDIYGGDGAKELPEAWESFFSKASEGKDEGKGRSYIAIQAYLKPGPETDQALQKLRDRIQSKHRMAVTTGYGPRFLHSTGQLHKGDAGKGLFIQLTADPAKDLPIPDQPAVNSSSISFGVLKSAQASGDRQALLDAGRTVIRFHLNQDVEAGIEKLTESL